MRTVHIIGKGAGWQLAPRDGETWGITQLILTRPVARVIDMNDYRLWGEKEAREAEDSKAAALAMGVPYFALAADPGNAAVQAYPLAEVVRFFGTDYFGGTVDYAVAMALWEGFRRIELYGVNLIHFSDYQKLKPSCEFWLGVAMGLGCKVVVHGAKSELLVTPDRMLYGYGTAQDLALSRG